MACHPDAVAETFCPRVNPSIVGKRDRLKKISRDRRSASDFTLVQPFFRHTARMDEDQLYIEVPPYTPPRPVTDMLPADLIASRFAELPTRKEMYRAVLLGVTAGAGLVQCLAWLFRYLA
jgi:hypothetical protein